MSITVNHTSSKAQFVKAVADTQAQIEWLQVQGDKPDQVARLEDEARTIGQYAVDSGRLTWDEVLKAKRSTRCGYTWSAGYYASGNVCVHPKGHAGVWHKDRHGDMHDSRLDGVRA